MGQQAASIIVDWGTTSLRATLVTAEGQALDHLETQQGISVLAKGEHEKVLLETLQPWLTAHGALPIAALGMITSRNGWVEVDYVHCPAGLEELSHGTVTRTLPNGSQLVFLAGLTDPAGKPFADVMRGEETQVVGLGLASNRTVILPGTHSKWALVADGRIARFQTFVTGEIFSLLMNHSFIARGAANPPVEDAAAFRRGLKEAAGTGAMLSLLFSARTGGLAKEISADELRSYVSGLVIGQEFRQASEEGWFKAGDEVAIVGNDGLNGLYGVAASTFGLTVKEASGSEAIDGAIAILKAACDRHRDV
ncbi:2-dehydro-3-deoxygalactonokinase [Tianweitania sp.]|uniref:2-dehydro-3-deoxygalactonokinase n=1 Tax=Tianweitania sp. TaxID=2021634 RepID=UPI00289B42D0|nr:2-dehydro-3-deoxygalactonokinase [Tianweitania sp.]